MWIWVTEECSEKWKKGEKQVYFDVETKTTVDKIVYWRVVFIQGRHLIELMQVKERLARGLALIIFRDLRGFINFFHVKCLPVEFMY